MTLDDRTQIMKASAYIGEKLNVASCMFTPRGGYKTAEVCIFADTTDECAAIGMTLNEGKKAAKYRDILTNMMANVAAAVNGSDLEMARIAFETAQDELSELGVPFIGHPTINTKKGTN